MADSTVGRDRTVSELARPPAGVTETILHHNNQLKGKKKSVASSESSEVELARRRSGQQDDEEEDYESITLDGEKREMGSSAQARGNALNNFRPGPGVPRQKRAAIVKEKEHRFTATFNETEKKTQRRIRLIGSNLVDKKNFCFGLFTPSDEFLYGHRYKVQGIAWHGKSDEVGAVPLLASVASDYELGKPLKAPLLQRLFPMFFDADVPDRIGEVIIWDVVKKTPLLFINVLTKKELVDSEDEGGGNDTPDDDRLGVCGVCWSPDGDSLACGGSNVIYLLNARTGRALCKHGDLRWGKVDNNDVVDARCVAWSPRVNRRSGEDSFELLAWGLHASNYACSYIFLSAVRDVPHLKRKDVTPPKLAHQGQEGNDVVFPLTFGKVTALHWKVAGDGVLLLYSFSASVCNESKDPPDNSKVADAQVNTVVVWECDVDELKLTSLRRYMIDTSTDQWQPWPDSSEGAIAPEDEELLKTFGDKGKTHPLVGDSRFVSTTIARPSTIARHSTIATLLHLN